MSQYNSVHLNWAELLQNYNTSAFAYFLIRNESRLPGPEKDYIKTLKKEDRNIIDYLNHLCSIDQWHPFVLLTTLNEFATCALSKTSQVLARQVDQSLISAPMITSRLTLPQQSSDSVSSGNSSASPTSSSPEKMEEDQYSQILSQVSISKTQNAIIIL